MISTGRLGSAGSAACFERERRVMGSAQLHPRHAGVHVQVDGRAATVASLCDARMIDLGAVDRHVRKAVGWQQEREHRSLAWGQRTREVHVEKLLAPLSVVARCDTLGYAVSASVSACQPDRRMPTTASWNVTFAIWFRLFAPSSPGPLSRPTSSFSMRASTGLPSKARLKLSRSADP